jgi:uncharacterized protein YigE (DUF2233 family)
LTSYNAGAITRKIGMMSPLIQLCAASLLCLAALGSAQAEPCRNESFADTSYIVCSFDLTKEDLRMFWRGEDGRPYRTFAALAVDLKAKGTSLRFAMNGGMYQDDLRPVGLYIENGRELIPNFYKKPNGVFYIGNGKVGILETGRFLARRPESNFATQSGPMLVIDGAIHPAFIVDSNDRKPRNGVGVSSPTEVHFVITQGWVNFYEFAHFFRDGLGAGMPFFSTEARRLGSMHRSSAATTRPAMAVMGPSSLWWSSATFQCPKATFRYHATDRL